MLLLDTGWKCPMKLPSLGTPPRSGATEAELPLKTGDMIVFVRSE